VRVLVPQAPASANFKDSVNRYEAARDGLEKLNVTFKDTYWTLGGHDLVAILDTPDEETLAAALLMLSSRATSVAPRYARSALTR
jgi:uncharacterized protein with GYD domain